MLVPPGDGPALAAALRRLLSDDALRARMGVAALERARALPTWDDTASLLLNALGAAVVGRTAQ
jgi:glycosyltransferase involved in cell wall biosynthesis